MATVHDVAAYILEQHGREMSTMKLQKLVYYSQAWHLVWDEEQLFPEPIQAWANGPVVYALFDRHRGQFSVSTWTYGNSNQLTSSEKQTIDIVLSNYGDLSGQQLSALTHSERPWQEARRGLGPTDRSNSHIDLDTMQEFYTALLYDEEASSIDDIDWGDDPF